MAKTVSGSTTYSYYSQEGQLLGTYADGDYTDYYYLGREMVARYSDSTPSDAPGYTGHVEDDDLGLVYMQQRYYDANIGRFYSNDPVGFKASNPTLFNRYTYANNNPYKYVDPDGREGVGLRLDMRVKRLASGEISSQEFLAENKAEAMGGLAAVSLLVPGPEDLVAASVLGRTLTLGQGQQVASIIRADGTTTASEIRSKAEAVGFTPNQRGSGPLKMVDENGTARVTIKSGSNRAPGSGGPHVELKDSGGQRVNPAGEPVTRRSLENHTPIRDDR